MEKRANREQTGSGERLLDTLTQCFQFVNKINCFPILRQPCFCHGKMHSLPQFRPDQVDLCRSSSILPNCPPRRCPKVPTMPSFLPTRLFDKGWCSALGMAAVLTLSTAPLVASPSAAVELEPAAIDETVFPIGAPPAMIEATEGGKPGARLWRDDALALLPDAISTGAISTSAIMATPPLFRFATSPLALAADRHILVGLMLLAVAAMASVSFGLWRWQVRGFHHAAEDRLGGGSAHAA